MIEEKTIPMSVWSGNGGNEYVVPFPVNNIKDVFILLDGKEINATLTRSGTIKIPSPIEKSQRLVILERTFALKLITALSGIGDELEIKNVSVEMLNNAFEIIDKADSHFKLKEAGFNQITEAAIDKIDNKLKLLASRQTELANTVTDLNALLARIPEINKLISRFEQINAELNSRKTQLEQESRQANEQLMVLQEAQASIVEYAEIIEELQRQPLLINPISIKVEK